MYTKYTLDPSFRYDVYLCLYKNVENVQELLAEVKNGQIECALLNPQLVYDPFQVVVAANKSVLSLENDNMKTRNVHSEIIYNLSPSKNIMKSLTTFGIHEEKSPETKRDVLVAILYKKDSEKPLEQYCPHVKGEIVSLSDVNIIKDVSRIEKVYSINGGNLLNKLITILATK